MHDAPQLTADDVVSLLRPPKDKDATEACRRDVIAAIEHVKEPKPQMLSGRRLRNVADKLAAVQRAINGLPPEWRSGSESYLQETARLRVSFANLADAQKRKGGRNRDPSYRRKLVAAQEVFWLMIHWGEHAPTETKGGPYLDGTAKVFEIATGKSGDVSHACEQVIAAMKKIKYAPSKLKLAEYRRFMAITGVSP